MIGLLLNLSRVVGLVAACAAVLLYGVAFARIEFTWLLALMMVLALVAAWASMTVWPFVLIAVFVASFLPVGFYLALTPSFLKWVAVCDLLFLAAGGLMLLIRVLQRSGNGTANDRI